jgi:hypothetical protein
MGWDFRICANTVPLTVGLQVSYATSPSCRHPHPCPKHERVRSLLIADPHPCPKHEHVRIFLPLTPSLMSTPSPSPQMRALMCWVSSHRGILLQWPRCAARVLGGVKCRSLSRSPLRNVKLRLGARLDPSRVGSGYLKPRGGAALPGSVGMG